MSKSKKTTTKSAATKTAKPPILTGRDALAAIKGKGEAKNRLPHKPKNEPKTAGQKVIDTIDAGGGIMVDVVEKVATAAGKAAEQIPAAKPEKTKAKKPRAAREGGKLSGLDAAAKVLGEAETPLNVKTIVERMLAQGLWSSGGKTPAATIYSAMIREIDSKPGESRFKKTDRGLFTVVKPKI